MSGRLRILADGAVSASGIVTGWMFESPEEAASVPAIHITDEAVSGVLIGGYTVEELRVIASSVPGREGDVK